MKKQVTLYTDGACSGNPGIGGYAGILIYGEIRREYNGGELSTTNNRMEVLRRLPSIDTIRLYFQFLAHACDLLRAFFCLLRLASLSAGDSLSSTDFDKPALRWGHQNGHFA